MAVTEDDGPWPEGVEITHGRVQLNNGFIAADYPTVKVYEFDLRTKYAVVGSTTRFSDDDFSSVTVDLDVTEDTLRADGPEGRTAVKIPLQNSSHRFWLCLSECRRYTLTIVLYTYPQEEE